MRNIFHPSLSCLSTYPDDSFLDKYKNEPSGRVELNETHPKQALVIEKNKVSKHERTFISPGVISDEADEVFFR